MNGSVLDIGLGLVLLFYAVSGYRQGFVVSILSLAGFLAGGAVAMVALPRLSGVVLGLGSNEPLRAIVVVGIVFVCAAIGQAIFVMVGGRLRPRQRRSTVSRLDSIGGLIAVTVATSLLLWLVAGAIRPAASPRVTTALADSLVLRIIDRVVPDETGQLFAQFRSMLDAGGFPRVFEGLGREPITPVEAPDGSSTRQPAIEAVAGSIVKVLGTSAACDQGHEGTGWVAAPGRIVTNAHVVAGLDQIVVRVRGVGLGRPASVVLFDPARDLAVLDVPGLDAKPLLRGSTLDQGESAVVAGFPLNGPYNLQAARVRGTMNAGGSDIYGKGRADREVYSLRVIVREGNSGGPLLDPRGRVVGVVFAKSLDDPQTGYALTLKEADPVLRQVTAVNKPVSTGECLTY